MQRARRTGLRRGGIFACLAIVLSCFAVQVVKGACTEASCGLGGACLVRDVTGNLISLKVGDCACNAGFKRSASVPLDSCVPSIGSGFAFFIWNGAIALGLFEAEYSPPAEISTWRDGGIVVSDFFADGVPAGTLALVEGLITSGSGIIAGLAMELSSGRTYLLTFSSIHGNSTAVLISSALVSLELDSAFPQSPSSVTFFGVSQLQDNAILVKIGCSRAIGGGPVVSCSPPATLNVLADFPSLGLSTFDSRSRLFFAVVEATDSKQYLIAVNVSSTLLVHRSILPSGFLVNNLLVVNSAAENTLVVASGLLDGQAIVRTVYSRVTGPVVLVDPPDTLNRMMLPLAINGGFGVLVETGETFVISEFASASNVSSRMKFTGIRYNSSNSGPLRSWTSPFSNFASAKIFAPTLDCDGSPKSPLGNRAWDTCGQCGGANSCLLTTATTLPTTTGASMSVASSMPPSASRPAKSGGEIDLVLVVALVGACVVISALVVAVVVLRVSKRHLGESSEAIEMPLSEVSNGSLMHSPTSRSAASSAGILPKQTRRRKKSSNYDPVVPSNLQQQGRVGRDSTDETWWQISFLDIELGKKLGAGSFGVVYRGIFRGHDVAVKMLHNTDQLSSDQIEEFKNEAVLMLHIPVHENVVQLYGVAHAQDGKMAIVVEYVALGSLKDLIDKSEVSFSVKQIVDIAIDIARGMQHIHLSKVFHRDLACRNVLMKWLDMETGTYQAKIADFGLSRASDRDQGTTTTDTGPLKWMAPESLNYKKYSSASDMWSYGILLWELIAQSDPYPELDNIQAAAKVMTTGFHPVTPESAPPKLADIMMRSWEQKPEDRLTFAQALAELAELADEIAENPFY